MGVYSWLTADTQESIRVDHRETVYLLQPNGQEAIAETRYEGYGKFGSFDIDAHEWLANVNAEQFGLTPVDLPALSERRFRQRWQGTDKVDATDFEPLPQDEHEMLQRLRTLGIGLDVGTVWRDKETGEVWSLMTDYRPLVGGIFFRGTGETEIPELGTSLNTLTKQGRFEEVPVSALIEFKPLKFSYNKAAVYEYLPASKQCPKQGIF